MRAKPASLVNVLEEENSSSVDDDLSNGKRSKCPERIVMPVCLVLPERFYSLNRLQPADRR